MDTRLKDTTIPLRLLRIFNNTMIIGHTGDITIGNLTAYSKIGILSLSGMGPELFKQLSKWLKYNNLKLKE